MSTTTTPLEVALGVAASAVFLFVCLRNIRMGLATYLLSGWLPLDLLALQGNRISTSLRPAHVFATILLLVWLVRWRVNDRPLVREPFEHALLLLLPLAVLSLLTGFSDPDPAVDQRHMKIAVSLGQILLMVWAIALHIVARHVVTSGTEARRLAVLLAVPAVLAYLVPVLPRPQNLAVGWTQPLALFASPYCLAMALRSQGLLRRAWLLSVWLVPLVIGVWAGRAFYYGYFAVATAVVVALSWRRQVLLAAPLAAAALALYLALAPTGSLPGPLKALVERETQQQSLGGPAGRLSIWNDALEIWTRHPLLGVGPGNSWPYMNRYSVIDTPHSQYFNLLLELGLVGLACFVVFLVLAWRHGLRAWRRASDRDASMFLTGWLGGFAGLALGSIVGDFMLPSIRNAGLELFTEFYPQWVLLGAMAGVAGAPRQEDAPARDLDSPLRA